MTPKLQLEAFNKSNKSCVYCPTAAIKTETFSSSVSMNRNGAYEAIQMCLIRETLINNGFSGFRRSSWRANFKGGGVV